MRAVKGYAVTVCRECRLTGREDVTVQHAFDHPGASRAYVRAHSQEMSDEVCDAHIKLYVNDLSLDVGDEGLRAIARLTAPPASSQAPA